MIQRKGEIKIIDKNNDHLFAKSVNRACGFLGEFAVIFSKENEDFVQLLFVFSSESDSYHLALMEEKVTFDKKGK